VFIPPHTTYMFTFHPFKSKSNPAGDGFHPRPEPEYTGPVNLNNLKTIFSQCADFQIRPVCAGGKSYLPVQVVFLDGVVSGTDVSNDVIRPLTEFFRFVPAANQADCVELIVNGAVFSRTMNRRDSLDDVVSDLTHGFCAIVFDSCACAVTFEVRGTTVRGVGEPSVEKTVKGSKDAFVETLRVNTSLIRRRVATPALKTYQTTVGRKSRTIVSLLYIDGVADEKRVQRIQAQLDNMELDGLLTAGTLEESLVDRPNSPFPQMIHTERPDKFSAALLDGRIGILVDGIPMGFLLPATLPQFIKVSEDDAQHFIIGSTLELLRYLAMLLSVLLPALYVAIAMYHQEMLPLKLLQSVIESKQKVPFSTALEIIGMLISFELLQEAGLRLPNSVGQTISIIGALIVGQSAVEAQVISPIAVIVVALAGTCGYTQPSQDMGNALRLCRFLLVLAALLAGMFGLMAGLCLFVWHLCSIDSQGTAYLSPLCDSGLTRTLMGMFRPPVKLVKYRDREICGPDRRRQK
jgi:spore germination protein KA